MENNFFEISIAVLPIFLYAFIVNKIIPKRMVFVGRAKRYFLAGMVIPFFCLAIKFALPTIFHNESIFATTGLKQALHFDYIEAGLLEEILKLSAFIYVHTNRRNSIYDLPIATVFYYMMCSAGFALAENISYLLITGDVLNRSYSALVMHFIVGIIGGYFMQKALNKKTVLTEKRSLTERYKPLISKCKIIAQGIVAAILFHGTYNFNFSLPNNYYSAWHMSVMLVLGMVISKWMLNEGVRLSSELRRKNYHKDHYENFR